MTAILNQYLTEEDYLVAERKAEFKSEYYKGEIFAMEGAGNNHNVIVSSVIGEIYAFLRGKKCTVYPSDIKVHIPINSLYTYPDVSVVCSKKEFLDDKQDTILNPVLIIEVLSESTEKYDRGQKFRMYRDIASLKEYVLISSKNEYFIERYFKEEEKNWEFTSSQDLENGSVLLKSIDMNLFLKDVYAQVEEM